VEEMDLFVYSQIWNIWADISESFGTNNFPKY